MKAFIALFLLTATLSCYATKPVLAPAASTTKEEDIVKCEKDADCVIVPYRHCCGATKKAINKKFLELYNKTSEWQKFDNPQICAVAGVCLSDDKVKDAQCETGRCQLLRRP